MGYSIRYTLGLGETCDPQLRWCEAQGWRHIIDWRWFKNPPRDLNSGIRTVQFHFEDNTHAQWFLLRWGGELTGRI